MFGKLDRFAMYHATLVRRGGDATNEKFVSMDAKPILFFSDSDRWKKIKAVWLVAIMSTLRTGRGEGAEPSRVGYWEALKRLWWWLIGVHPLDELNGGVKLQLQEAISGNRVAPLASGL